MNLAGAIAVTAAGVPITGVPIDAAPSTGVPSREISSALAGRHAVTEPVQDDRLRHRIDAFHATYCDALDNGRLSEWPQFFTEDAFYRIIARENRDLGLPVGLVYCEGRAMLRDRAFAIANTAMHAPRYLRHFVSNIRIDAIEEGGAAIRARANFLVYQVLADHPSATLHLIGEYHDVYHLQDCGSLLIAARDCIYDNTLIDNALVYPV